MGERKETKVKNREKVGERENNREKVREYRMQIMRKSRVAKSN